MMRSSTMHMKVWTIPGKSRVTIIVFLQESKAACAGSAIHEDVALWHFKTWRHCLWSFDWGSSGTRNRNLQDEKGALNVVFYIFNYLPSTLSLTTISRNRRCGYPEHRANKLHGNWLYPNTIQKRHVRLSLQWKGFGRRFDGERVSFNFLNTSHVVVWTPACLARRSCAESWTVYQTVREQVKKRHEAGNRQNEKHQMTNKIDRRRLSRDRCVTEVKHPTGSRSACRSVTSNSTSYSASNATAVSGNDLLSVVKSGVYALNDASPMDSIPFQSVCDNNNRK